MKLFKIQTLLLICSLIFVFGCKKKQSGDELSWISIEEAENLSKDGDKKFLVDVYTDWCGWCKVMDKKTFTDPELIKYLNENFHVVKFNAEQKEPVTFKGQTYVWEPMGRNGVNMLGVELLQSNLSYPTLVYLDEKLNRIAISPGYKDPQQLLSELKGLQ